MKILLVDQIRKLDQKTIVKQNINSWDLMEKAGNHFFQWMMEKNKGRYKNINIFVGPGNNGGDGLVIARLAFPYFEKTTIISLSNSSSGTSEDFEYQLAKLPKSIDFYTVNSIENLEAIEVSEGIVIDAIFGSGLNRVPEGIFAAAIQLINDQEYPVFSVDIPSGLFADSLSDHKTIVKATYTGSFELAKLSFFYIENQIYTGKWELISIGLDQETIKDMDSIYEVIEKETVAQMVKRRKPHHHKGNFGHCLLVVGSKGMAGAAILSTRAAMRAGAGKTTAIVPDVCLDLLQVSVPEAMIQTGHGRSVIIDFKPDITGDALAIGCGIGKNIKTVQALEQLVEDDLHLPLVLDADALNIIADKNLCHSLPPNTIITPHPGEYKRLFGIQSNSEKRIENQIHNSIKYQLYIVYKEAFTTISTPSGKVFFNSTGNPGMATAGSGDVLTGIIASLLAQGYQPDAACKIGVYIHGFAGDLAAEEQGYIGLNASDIIDSLPLAFHKLYNIKE